MLAAISVAALLYGIGIVRRVPGLRGPPGVHPFSWQWEYRQSIRPARMLAPAVLAAVLAAGFCRFVRHRRPGAMLGFIIGSSVLFRCVLNVCDGTGTIIGPARILTPRPIDFLLDASETLSLTDLFRNRHLPRVHDGLRAHSSTKPPGFLLLAKSALWTARRCTRLRQSLLAWYRPWLSTLRRYASVGGAPADVMLAAAILWSYGMCACAIVAVLPLYAVARDLAGEHGALWTAAFWLFCPTAVLFSSEFDQLTCLLAVLSLWLVHSAHHRGSLTKAALAGLAAWACLLLTFGALTTVLLIGAYVAARHPLGERFPVGRRVGLAAMVLAVLFLASRSALTFEVATRLARYRESGFISPASLFTGWSATWQAVLARQTLTLADAHRAVMPLAAMVVHFGLLAGLAAGLCRGRARLARGSARRPLALGVPAAFCAALLAAWWLTRTLFGLRLVNVYPLAVYESHAAISAYRSYWPWLLWNPLCFFIFGGLPAAALCVWVWLSPRRLGYGLSALGFAVCLALVCTTVSGVTRGEVERIWLPVLPLVCVLAGAQAARLRRHWAWLPTLLGLQIGQTILFAGYLAV